MALEEELKTVQKQLLDNEGQGGLEGKEAESYQRLQKAKLMEEDGERQKSRVLWLDKGDLNTAFFRWKTRTRKSINTIDRLQRRDGTWIEEEEQLIEEIVGFYTELYGTLSGETLSLEDDQLRELVARKVPENRRVELTRIPTDEEIKKAVWSIPDDKSPGPDGFSSFFFQNSWELVGVEVCEAV